MMQYDGVAEFMMPSAKCFDDARRDPYYKEHVQPDEEKFFDMDKIAMLVGYEDLRYETK